MTPRRVKAAIAALLAVLLVGGVAVVLTARYIGKTTVVARLLTESGLRLRQSVSFLRAVAAHCASPR